MRGKDVKVGKGIMCIDVDLDEDIPLSKTLNYLRALYEYSFIPREVRVTNHGLHIYINIPYPKSDRELAIYLRRRYGDDERRIEWDMVRRVVNICFTSTERYITKPRSVDHIVFENPEVWLDG